MRKISLIINYITIFLTLCLLGVSYSLVGALESTNRILLKYSHKLKVDYEVDIMDGFQLIEEPMFADWMFNLSLVLFLLVLFVTYKIFVGQQ